MTEEDGLFLEACGAIGPLELEWVDRESGEAVRRTFDRPSVLVGRGPDTDLSLSHPLVGRRHAYLQMVEGRLYAIDLGSRDGLRWSGVPRRSGWVDRRRPMQLGPVTIRVIQGDRPEGEEPGAGPGPLSRRFAARHPLPGVALKIGGAEGEPRRMSIERALTLVGSAPECKLRLLEPGTSRYACALVRTPKGVWMVDLLSSRGVKVNGVACRRARLEDGDVIRVGRQSIRLTYEGSAIGPRHRASAGPPLPAPIDLPVWADQIPMEATQEAWELVPEIILGQIRDRGGPPPESSAPFHHALLMILRLVGDMHRDHLQVVREEMEQIRRLNQEMGALRARLPGPGPATPDLESSAPAPAPALEGEGASSLGPAISPHDRPAPEAVQALVGERLAAWEKERQSRWRKVMDLLVTPRPA